MITVTINVRDLDPTVGPVPAWATVSFARLVPSTSAGTLVTTEPVDAVLNDQGQGSMLLAPATAYEVRCSGLSGFDAPFVVLTGTTGTTLADLWQTGQISYATAAAVPVPKTWTDLLTAQAAAFAALYPPMQATPPDHTTVVAYIDTSTVPPVLKGWNGTAWVPLGSNGGGVVPGDAFTDNGDGTYTPTTFTVTDAGDGTWTSSGTVTDLGDGTFNLAA